MSSAAQGQSPASGAEAPRWSMNQWLGWIEDVNRGRGIRLSLERMRTAWRRLGRPRIAERIVTVTGTNGKGSVVHLLSDILGAHGVKTGRYTSPHLRRFNERISIGGRLAGDGDCQAAFAEVWPACRGLGVTYFEFVTLAGALLMSRQRLDIAVLEVGLGGRYDATNAFDCDLAIITSIGLDHREFLGDSLAGIAREKCGIMRPGKMALSALDAASAPAEVREAIAEEAKAIGADLLLSGRDWSFCREGRGCLLNSMGSQWRLPLAPSLGATGMDNAAVAVVAAASLLGEKLDEAILSRVIEAFALPGRFQRGVAHPHIIYDTAHNPAAAARLAARIGEEGLALDTIALNARSDKDLEGLLASLALPVRQWLCLDFGSGMHPPRDVARALRGLMDSGRIPAAGIAEGLGVDEAAALLAVADGAEGAVKLVCGSFSALEEVMEALGEPESAVDYLGVD